MSDNSTTKLIDMYMEEAEAPMFLSGFFQSPRRNFHAGEKIGIDIIRDDEDLAIVLTDLSVGANQNESSRYVNKEFTPPIFDEEIGINSYNLVKRQAGNDPFTDPDYGAAALEEAFSGVRKLERKIRRSIELMASQVLQTGTITLTDAAAATRYTLNYQAKNTHVATVTTTWSAPGVSATGAPLTDLAALARVVRRDGKSRPDRLIFGSSAMQRFLANADVQKFLVKDGLGLGSLAPQTRGEGASFCGKVWIDNYLFELWMYDGFYRDPATGNHADYVGTNNVIMMSSTGRLDLSYGAIPLIGSPDPTAMPFLPGRMSSADRGLDLTLNAWRTPDRKHLKVSAGTRPLVIPTAIDTFACLTVVAAG
jgi:hypothetical protein